ncbi:MAG: type II toxin-antitoxin system VapC family toxin [Thiobacillaceae bacterium]|nr:type II toxin-antitoxin system VapC family toxin [Thiobacillaceae bacterium]MCX7672725.1 type II toxin-antitoxin system VapC family toxin [Thiobacillaceae bacterium]
MIGLDTNVLVRLLVDDGSAEVERVRTWIAERAAEGHEFHVDTVVLAETVWVLDRVYGYQRGQIADALSALLNNAAYAVDARPAVAEALALYRSGRADFADGLIAVRCRAAGCTQLASMDRAMRKLPGVVLI